jgi:hypothetical protein
MRNNPTHKSIGRKSATPPAGRSLRRRSRLYYSTAFESCGALRREKDRREALRFPALRVGDQGSEVRYQ